MLPRKVVSTALKSLLIAGEIGQSMKCLLYKCEDLGLISPRPHVIKLSMVVHAYHPSAGKTDR